MQQEVVTVGVDLAKNAFLVHAIDPDGKVLVRRQLRRAEVLTFFATLKPCLVGMEACASAHHWGRELLALGHNVRLIVQSARSWWCPRPSERRRQAFD